MEVKRGRSANARGDMDASARGAVVITGASRGIGEACAFRLARTGFQVFAGVRRETDGDALKRTASGGLIPIVLDVTRPDSIASAATAVAAAVGPSGLAGLVNNAGIAVAGPLEFLPIAELRRQLEVNVIGQVAVTQAFLPLLRRRRGRIVNIGSVSGRIAAPFVGPYAASKFAMAAFTDALRLELSPWGLSVSLVEPGSVATPIWERSVAATDELLETLPPEAHEFYGRILSAVRRFASRRGAAGMSADRVARAVEHALTSTRPRTRYLVGADAWLGALVSRLPDRVRDWMLLARYRLVESRRSSSR